MLRDNVIICFRDIMAGVSKSRRRRQVKPSTVEYDNATEIRDVEMDATPDGDGAYMSQNGSEGRLQQHPATPNALHFEAEDQLIDPTGRKPAVFDSPQAQGESPTAPRHT